MHIQSQHHTWQNYLALFWFHPKVDTVYEGMEHYCKTSDNWRFACPNSCFTTGPNMVFLTKSIKSISTSFCSPPLNCDRISWRKERESSWHSGSRWCSVSCPLNILWIFVWCWQNEDGFILAEREKGWNEMILASWCFVNGKVHKLFITSCCCEVHCCFLETCRWCLEVNGTVRIIQ